MVRRKKGLFDLFEEAADFFDKVDTGIAGDHQKKRRRGKESRGFQAQDLIAVAAAAGLHAMRTKTSYPAQKTKRKRTADNRAKLSKLLDQKLRDVEREVSEISKPVWVDAASAGKRLERSKLSIAFEPDKEPLLDEQVADSFFNENRRALRDAQKTGEQAHARVRQEVLLTIDEADQVQGHEAIVQNQIDANARRIEKKIAFTGGKLDEVDEALKTARQKVNFAMSQEQSFVEKSRFLCIPANTPLTPVELEALHQRAKKPFSDKMLRLLATKRTAQLDRHDVAKALASIEIDSEMIADAVEREALVGFLLNHFKHAIPVKGHWQHIFDCCSECVKTLDAEMLSIDAVDTARIAAAFVLAAEYRTRTLPLTPLHWPAFERAFPGLWEGLPSHLSREEAVGFLDRLEAVASDPKNPIGKSGFSFPHLELVTVLRRIAGRSGRGPAWEAYEAYIARREEHRRDIISKVDPIWRDQFRTILDTPEGTEGDTPQVVRKVLLPLADLDGDALSQVGFDLESLKRARNLSSASKAREWKWMESRYLTGSVAPLALPELRILLDGKQDARDAYFADAPQFPELETFEPFFSSYRGRGQSEVLTRDVAKLLRSGKFKKALALVSQRLQKAPPHPVRDAIAAVELGTAKLTKLDIELSGLATADIAAIGIDISGHTMDGFCSGILGPLYFEVNSYHKGTFDFSGIPLPELNEVCSNDPVPWQGAFEDISTELQITGLENVLVELKRAAHPTSSEKLLILDQAVRDLGEWWLFCVVAIKLRHAINELGDTRELTFILGTHSFGTRMPIIAMR